MWGRLDSSNDHLNEQYNEQNDCWASNGHRPVRQRPPPCDRLRGRHGPGCYEDVPFLCIFSTGTAPDLGWWWCWSCGRRPAGQTPRHDAGTPWQSGRPSAYPHPASTHPEPAIKELPTAPSSSYIIRSLFFKSLSCISYISITVDISLCPVQSSPHFPSITMFNSHT